MKRCMTNILSADVEAAARFYEALLGLNRHFDSDWFIILTHDGVPGLEFGLLQRNHAIVPEEARAAPSGIIVTFVVEDCDAVARRAQDLGAPVLSPPTDMPYGQRRMLLRDPDGTVIDVSAPTAPRPA